MVCVSDVCFIWYECFRRVFLMVCVFQRSNFDGPCVSNKSHDVVCLFQKSAFDVCVFFR